MECQVEQRRGGCSEQRNVGVVVKSPAQCWAFLVRVDTNSQRAERKWCFQIVIEILNNNDKNSHNHDHDDYEFCFVFSSFSVNSGLMANVKKAFTGEVK